MAVQHASHPVHGVQFHPESVLTEQGYRLLDHFLHGVPADAPPAFRSRADGALLPPTPEAATLASDPPAGGPGPVIVENIVTTHGAGGSDQLRPHGGGVGRGPPSYSSRSSRPPPSETCARAGSAVVNLTDDAMLFAQGAISSPQFPPSLPSGARRGSGGGLFLARARGPLDGCHATSIPDGGPGGASGLPPGVHRIQPGAPRRPGGGHPGDPDPPVPGRADPRPISPGSR